MRTPDLFVLFCDDTREEVGNKTSFMGVLGPEIGVLESGLLKSLVVVGMVRCFEHKDYPAVIEVKFEGPEGLSVPDAVRHELTLSPQGPSEEWTANIVGSYAGISVAPGIVARATLTVGGITASAQLQVTETRVPG